MTTMRKRVEAPPEMWRDTGQADAGHTWEAFYRDNVMVYVRCKHCHGSPMDYLRVDSAFSACPGFIPTAP